ncbi:hypothetical protein M141_0793 [Bacteroides fragilis str. S38L5]|nr:hypothetical protein M145_0733 [Bacteroides fragilis str. 34-F-2 \
MVLNFITLKILPSLPGRFCKKKTPAPLLAKYNQKTIMKSIGQQITKVQKTRLKSITRFKKERYI